MPNVVTLPVETRRQRKAFLEFPWRHYRGDANWIPPLRMDQAELVNYRYHPFYIRNRIQTFLATRKPTTHSERCPPGDGEEVCGRIAAIVNYDHVEFQKEQRGFFGFFESVDDDEVAGSLMDAARAWLKAQGMESIRGPMSPSFNHVAGTLVEGFDTPPAFMTAYNPPYYERLLLGCGLQQSQETYAFWANAAMLPASQAKHWPIADRIMERYNIRIRPIRKSRFKQDMREFLNIYNESMRSHWSFSPISEEALEYMAKTLRYLVIPELIVGAEIDGKLVGIVLALPDYNPRIKQIDGRLLPLGFLRLLLGRRRIKKVRVMAANVLLEYQLLGVPLVLMRAMAPLGLAYGIDEVEYSWVAESNRHSRGGLEKAGAKRVKTYRLYDAVL